MVLAYAKQKINLRHSGVTILLAKKRKEQTNEALDLQCVEWYVYINSPHERRSLKWFSLFVTCSPYPVKSAELNEMLVTTAGAQPRGCKEEKIRTTKTTKKRMIRIKPKNSKQDAEKSFNCHIFSKPEDGNFLLPKGWTTRGPAASTAAAIRERMKTNIQRGCSKRNEPSAARVG